MGTRYIKFREPHVKAEMEASKKLMTAAKKHLMKDFNMDPSELEALIKEAFPAPSRRRLVKGNVAKQIEKYEKMSKKKYTGPARPKMVMRDANTGDRRRLVKGNVAKQIEKYEKMSKKKYTGPARPKMVMR